MRGAAGVTTPDQYLAALPADRRKEIAIVRAMVNKNTPKGFSEMYLWGMIAWAIPLSRYPDTYNKQPLCYAALAAQKNFNSLYLMGCYGDAGQLAALKRAFADKGQTLDMGKSCIHFQKADDLPLAEIGKLLAAVSIETWIDVYEKSRLMTKAGKAKATKSKATPRKTAASTRKK